MNIGNLQAQANQAQAQGQQLLAQDKAKAAQYTTQYDTEHTQAQAANKNLQAYTTYMQNAGNPTNLYNTGVSQAEAAQGFDPASLAKATQGLIQTQNQVSNIANAAQSSTGGYGLSGSQLGAYYGSISQPLQQVAQAQNTSVGNLQQLYQNALTQGQQGATLGFQGEQQVSGNLNQVYQNAQNQAAQSLSQMQFYSNLAQQQGGLNAQQQQMFASAVSGLQQAQAALESANAAMVTASAQSGYLGSETAGQKLQNISMQNQLNAQAAQQYAAAQKQATKGMTNNNGVYTGTF